MKAKDPITGNLKEVFVKAIDGLPVGTTVDYIGSSSNIPTGWEAISGQNKIIKTSEVRALAGSVTNIPNNSNTDAYSCNYINKLKNDMLEHPDYNIGINRIFRFLKDENYLSMQGVCVTQNKTLLCALWNGSGSNNNRVIEINYETGQIIKTRDVSFGWCNGITLNTSNNRIYLVPRGDTNGNSKKIKVLKYNDLSDDDEIIFSDYVQSIYYDKSKNEIYLMNEWNKKETDGLKIYKVNSNFDIQETIELQYSSINKLHIQNFAINEDYIYLLSSEPRCLCVFKKDGTLFKEYALPEIINELYYSGEYQDIDFLNNQCYIASGDVVTDVEAINQLFTVDFNKEDNNTDESLIPTHYGYSTTLYVDVNSTSINPDGSQTNKFKSINEALRFKGISNIQVADGTYHGIDIRGKTNTNITGNSSSVIIKGIKCTYNSNISIDTLTINSDDFNSNGYINLYESDIYIKNVTISGNKYGIYVGATSKCKLSSGVVLDGITSDNQIYVRSESVLYTPSTDYTIEKHNKSASVIGGIKLFKTDKSLVVGEFDFDENMNYIFDGNNSLNNYFKVIDIIYEIGANTYLQRFPLLTDRNPMQLGFDNMAGNGSFISSRSFVDIYNKKLRIRFSRIGNTTNAGVTTVVQNNDNDNPVENSIIIKNAILY